MNRQHASNAARMDRRQWLRWGGASLAGALGAGSLSALLQNPVKAQADGYKALVCVFLFGGNDQTNTVVPYDTAAFNAYTSVRAGIARPLAELRPLGPVASQEGRNFALPVELDPHHRRQAAPVSLGA